MNVRLFTLLFLLLSIPWSLTAQWHKRDARIHPVYFPVQYWGIHAKVKRQIKDAEEENIAEHLSACPIEDHAHNEEICLHNRFLLLDFILYYNLVKRYCPEDMDQSSFASQVARERDRLYAEWMLSLTNYEPTGYFEWENKTLDSMPLQEYLAKGSQRFRGLQFVSRSFNRKPSKRNPARRLVYDRLKAHSPFSSIQPELGFELASDDELLKDLDQILVELRKEKPVFNSTFGLLADSFDSEEMALQVLGSVSAQRMYMVRDYRSWLIQQELNASAHSQLMTFKRTSELYFTLESAGRAFGAQTLFPDSIEANSTSFKAYHFWTTALLSYQLAEAGFDEETCIKEAIRPAKKYKRFIQIPGVLHNLMLLRPIRNGTTADRKTVLMEQEKGAQWGYDLHRIHQD